jgi:type 1 glutamine amidotransferase/sugar phosphate isomerase/epimerase
MTPTAELSERVSGQTQRNKVDYSPLRKPSQQLLNRAHGLVRGISCMAGTTLLAGLLMATAAGAEDPSASSAGATVFLKNPEEIRRIEQAIPTRSTVKPSRPRKLLLFCLNVGYGGHPSIDYANQAFQLMGEKTGAFQVVVSRDPSIFRRESLQQFDAVFFNNTVGNCFADPELRRNLVDFVYGGGGLLGVHGTTVAFTRWPGAIEDWPEFGVMLGARGANHRESTEHVLIKLDDPSHPLNQAFPAAGFDYRDEFFRVQDPYSRQRVRVLFSIDTSKTEPNQGQGFGQLARPDNDYALAWIRNYGRGRVFYCTIAHNPYVFWDPKMLQFYFDAIQFALGDLPAPTTPSAFLSPAVRAQEKLDWRFGIAPGSGQKLMLFESIDRAAQLKLSYLGAAGSQTISRSIPKTLGPGLTDDEMRQVRLKLDSAGVRLLTYAIDRLPSDENGWRQVFEFGRKLGVATLIGEPEPDALPLIDQLGQQYDLRFALRSSDPNSSRRYWHPEAVLETCRNRSRHIGAVADLGQWVRAGVEPVEAIRKLNSRALVLQVQDLNTTGSGAHEVVWGTGQGRPKDVLRAVRQWDAPPSMITFPLSDPSLTATDQNRCVDFFNSTCLEIAP